MYEITSTELALSWWWNADAKYLSRDGAEVFSNDENATIAEKISKWFDISQ